MPWKFCFPSPSTNPRITIPREVCFYIPMLIRKFPDVDPGPWITKDFIDEKLARDLPVLATIDALASQLSNATVRKTVQRAVQGAVDPKSLPENMKIEFK